MEIIYFLFLNTDKFKRIDNFNPYVNFPKNYNPIIAYIFQKLSKVIKKKFKTKKHN